MSNFFDETMQGLLEAAEIAKGNITLTEWELPHFMSQIMCR